MTSREFCYWLQGYFEINKGATALTQEQSEIIQKHLSLVFIHEIDNSYGDAEHTAKLNDAHNKPKDNYLTHDKIDDILKAQDLRPRC